MKKSDTISDATLYAIAKGDQKAFRRFYDQYYPTIYRFARYFLHSGTDCNEVVSEVFSLFWENRLMICNIKNVEAYLYIVCRNESWHILKQKDKYQHISIDEMPVELSINSESVDSQLIEKEMFALYYRAINELPERCKLIFLMSREEKLNHKEIAHILNITEGTVEQQINIAIKKVLSIVRLHYPTLNRCYMLKLKKTL